MSNKLASLRRDLEHIRRHRAEIIQQKSRLATRLSDLNKDLKSKKIPYENYESKFKYLLGGKSVEEKKKYFKKRLVAIKHREKDLLSRIKHETHSSKNKTKLIAVTAIMFAMIAPLIGIGLIDLTGFATSTSSTTASAVVAEWYAVSSPGDINFGTLVHDTTGNNAGSNNWGSGSSGYYLTLHTDSNIDVKTCIKSVDWDGPSALALSNLKWNSSASSNSIMPHSPGSAMTTSYVTSQSSISPGGQDYYRFWMDIPSGQVAGDYNTTTTFKAITTSSSC
jgi:hypothetical protein